MSLIVFLAAAAVSLLATPLARRLAIRLRILDRPEARKMHQEAMPLLGGLAVAAGFAAGCLLAAALPGHRALPETPVLGLAIGALLMVGLGVYDDARGADARLKLSVQTLAALVVIASGSRIGILTIIFNNGIMAIETNALQCAHESFGANFQGGHYADMATSLGAWARRVETPAQFVQALGEAVRATESGRPAVIECMVKAGYDWPGRKRFAH